MLLQLANTITEGDNLQTFVEGIQLLISKCNAGETQANSTATALTNFATNDLDPDVQAFTVDYNNVNIAYNDDSQETQQLQNLIDADNKAMNTATWATAAAGVLTIAGGVAVVVGIFGEFESAGASTALVVGGFALAGGAATIGALEMTNWISANKNLIAATNQLNQEQAVLAATQQALANIQNLGGACSQASSAALGLGDSWGSLADDLQQTVDYLQAAEGADGAPAWLPSLLETANSEWQTVLTLATSLQANGTLPVSTQNQS
jgi:non-hemolytic enterotoxin B/C